MLFSCAYNDKTVDYIFRILESQYMYLCICIFQISLDFPTILRTNVTSVVSPASPQSRKSEMKQAWLDQWKPIRPILQSVSSIKLMILCLPTVNVRSGESEISLNETKSRCRWRLHWKNRFQRDLWLDVHNGSTPRYPMLSLQKGRAPRPEKRMVEYQVTLVTAAQ